HGRWPHLTTLHGRLDIPDLRPLYLQFPEQPLVSISNAQRKPLAFANWVGTVHHGLPLGLHSFRSESRKYLAFLGRISPEKRPDQAIEIALKAGMKLKMAAKVDPVDRAYHEQVIQPLLRTAGRHVEFIGEVGGQEKDEFLGNAYALLF